MNWGSASEFFAMGGHGLFVWGSYGAALLALLAEPCITARQHRRALAAAVGADDLPDDGADSAASSDELTRRAAPPGTEP